MHGDNRNTLCECIVQRGNHANAHIGIGAYAYALSFVYTLQFVNTNRCFVHSSGISRIMRTVAASVGSVYVALFIYAVEKYRFVSYILDCAFGICLQSTW